MVDQLRGKVGGLDMRTVLQDINRIPGVTGSFVLDRAGEIEAVELPSVFSADMVGVAGRMLAQTALGIEALQKAVAEMNFLFEAGRVIVRGFEGGLICVLAVENVSVPLLNMTLNAAVKRAAELAGQARPAEKARPAGVQDVAARSGSGGTGGSAGQSQTADPGGATQDEARGMAPAKPVQARKEKYSDLSAWGAIGVGYMAGGSTIGNGKKPGKAVASNTPDTAEGSTGDEGGGSTADRVHKEVAAARQTPRTPEPVDESEAERRLLETLGIKR